MQIPYPRYHKMPDPWCGNIVTETESGAGTNIRAAQATFQTWPSANLAIAIPVIFPADCTLYAMYAVVGTTTDNFDIGFYRDDFVAIARKGSTAVPATAAVQTLTIPEYRVQAGRIFYMAMAMNGTTSQVYCTVYATATSLDLVGAFSQASAFALPDPLVPAGVGQVRAPLFSFGIR